MNERIMNKARTEQREHYVYDSSYKLCQLALFHGNMGKSFRRRILGILITTFLMYVSFMFNIFEY